jgi:antitoxin component YwqK of YwqJK toxin-antitoxin module
LETYFPNGQVKQKTNFKKWNSWRRKAQFTIQQEFLSVELGQNGKIIPTKDLKNYSINEKVMKAITIENQQLNIATK